MQEEVKAAQVRVEQQSDTDGSEKSKKSSSSVGTEDEDEVAPRLHAKTFLIIFTVGLIYFTQVVNIVGTGAVSNPPAPKTAQRSSNWVGPAHSSYR
jgi:hypothetical protein